MLDACARTFVAVVSAVCLGSCGSPTGLLPVEVTGTVREVSLSSEERAAWPNTPSISGGPRIRIRGLADFGCSIPVVSAQRVDRTVAVEISRRANGVPCLAVTPAWRPYEAELTGLPLGNHDVRVRAWGLNGEARWTVNVLPPEP